MADVSTPAAAARRSSSTRAPFPLAAGAIRQWCPVCYDFTPTLTLSNTRQVCATCWDREGCNCEDCGGGE